MHPVKQIQKMMAGRGSSRRGTVVGVEGAAVMVATSNGTVSASRSPGDATQYRPGDIVALRDGQLAGKKAGSPPVFAV
jgi:hypothetical protein